MKTFLLALSTLACMYNAHAQLAAPDTLQTKMGVVTIQPIQHASLVLSVKGTTVYVDPTGADNYKGMMAPTIILVTDIHGDHFDIKTIDAVKTASTILVVPQVVADKLPDTDKTHLVVLKNGDNSTQAGISIMAIPMYNLPESPDAKHTKGRGNGYVLGIGGKNIYIFVPWERLVKQ
jgi:L-ascorbate metabolism protein UlaG (beta-lactamase superfamily)